MSPLLEALQAAQQVGFDAPTCRVCGGSKTRRALGECYDNEYWAEVGTDESCEPCHATGLDATGPEKLIGRAMLWLWSQKRNVTDDEYPNISAAIRDAETRCGMRGLKLVDDYAVKRHDSTVEGIATALLRLVARVGGGR